jgi:DNA-binding response OmpR family regulator
MEKNKILIIDDEVAFTEMVKLNLVETGRFTVQIENDPQMAVATALEFMPDVILLDIIMPDLEGPDVMSMVRAEPLLKNTPIVFLTATVRRDETVEGDGLIGGHVFLAKPCTVDELINVIDSLL